MLVFLKNCRIALRRYTYSTHPPPTKSSMGRYTVHAHTESVCTFSERCYKRLKYINLYMVSCF